MSCNTKLYCNRYCIARAVGGMLQYKYCIAGSWLGRQCHDTKNCIVTEVAGLARIELQ